jgi:hypothetical protein
MRLEPLRPELALWLLAGLLALIGGVLGLGVALRAAGPGGVRERARGLKERGPTVCAYLGLAALAGGLAWRGWVNRAWPGATAGEALLLVAAAALWLSTWVSRSIGAPHAVGAPDAAGPAGSNPEGVEGDAVAVSGRLAYGAGLVATGVLILGATALAWIAAPPVAPQAHSGLFGLRSGLASLGLGGWPFVCAGNLAALWQGRGKAAVSPTVPGPAQVVVRAGYPWLTAALLASGAWQMAAYAVPWRDMPADLWLVVAWLIGGVYLMLGSARWAKSLGAWPPAVLSLAGLAAALLAAGLTGSLFW